MLSLLVVTNLHITPTIAQTCAPDGDVNEDGLITPQDALQAFRHFLDMATPPLTDCQQVRANVFMPANTRVTSQDAQCVLRQFLNLPSCFSSQPEIPGRRTVEVRGNTQPAPPGTMLQVSLVARVEDAFRNPIAGVEVTASVRGDGAEISTSTLPATNAQLEGNTLRQAQTGVVTTATAITNAKGEAQFLVQGTVGTEDITAEVSVLGQAITVPIVSNGILLPNPNNISPVVVTPQAQTAIEGQAVELLISASDVNGDALTFSATNLPLGLSLDSSTRRISGTIDRTASQGSPYTVTLTVSDGTATTTVSFPWTVTNPPPVANAGNDQVAAVGATVTLNGTASQDPDGDTPLSFRWTFTSLPAGSAATLSDPTAAQPTFVADRPGTYVAQLVVDDGTADSPPDSISITALNPPVANAGDDQVVSLGSTVMLNGSASQGPGGNTPLSFHWSFAFLPASSSATLLDSTTSQPTLVADRPGTYIVQLIVNDGLIDSNPDTVIITTFALLVSSAGSNSILRYDGQSGAFLDTSDDSGGLSFPRGLVFGPDGHLYVSSGGSNSILRYDGQSGAFLDAFVPPGSGGLSFPEGLVFGPDGHLYVSSGGSNSILRYDGQSGAFLDAFVPPGSGGLNFPEGLVFGPDGRLYVSSSFSNSILRYDGQSGAFLDAFVPTDSGAAFVPADISSDDPTESGELRFPRGLVFGPDGHLYVSSGGANSILRYDGQSGAFLDAFVPPGSSGLNGPEGLIFGPDGHLYVSSAGSNSILRYDGQSGAFLDAFVPPGSSELNFPEGLVFGPDGRLYVSSAGSNSILRYDGQSGAFLDAFVPPGSGGLSFPDSLIFGPDGHLYVSSAGSGSILRYDGQSGAFLDTFVPAGSGGLDFPQDLVFGPDGHLYVSSANSDSILRYDGQSGTFLDTFVPAGSGGLDFPQGLVFGPDGHLYVSGSFSDSILRYDGQSGTFLDTFVPAGSGRLSIPQGLVFSLASPVSEPDIGTSLALSDDDFAFIAFRDGFTFPFFGVTYTGVYVNSNGRLTFDFEDTDFGESLEEFTEQPQIAPFFDDLTPDDTPMNVFVNQFADRFVVTYNRIPEFSETGGTGTCCTPLQSGEGSNTFQVILFADGNIRFSYNGLTARDAIVGISPGDSPELTESDLSTDVPFFTAAPSAIFEEFTGSQGDAFDLNARFIFFAPNGDGGYDVDVIPFSLP